MRAVITGSAGFVGRHLVRALEGAEWDVVGFDIAHTIAPSVGQITQGLFSLDILEDKWPSLAPVDVVFHLAAAPWGVSKNADFLKTNVYGTFRALELARDEGAKLVLASSMAMYGEGRREPFHEEDAPSPFSAYGLSKYLAEQTVRLFQREFYMDVVSLRCANIFGPGHEAIPYLMPDILRKLDGTSGPLVLRGTGKETRDFIYIDDVVSAYIRSVTLPPNAYNVGTGQAVTTLEVARALMLELGDERPVLFTHELGPNDAPEELPKAVNPLRLLKAGWTQKVTFQDGIRETVRAWKEYKEKGSL